MHVIIVLPPACVTAFFFDGRGFAEPRAGCGQLMKMLIALGPHGIFGSNFAYFGYFKVDQSLVCKTVLLHDSQVCTLITILVIRLSVVN